jgi:hypothetical protein
MSNVVVSKDEDPPARRETDNTHTNRKIDRQTDRQTYTQDRQIHFFFYLNALPRRHSVTNMVVSEDEDPLLAEELGRLVVRVADVFAIAVAQENGGSDFATLKQIDEYDTLKFTI